MPYFLKRMTVNEFYNHIKALPIGQLVKLNKEYADPFIQISTREENTQNELQQLTSRLSFQKEKLATLNEASSQIDKDEQRWRAQYQSIEGGRTERYLQRSTLIGCSPSQSHSISVMTCTNEISLLERRIENIEKRIEAIANDKALLIQELKMINRFISDLRQAVISEPTMGISAM
ncbi:hypothetical protein [Legionella fallonii]|uniref:Uncharacterized protein n=1 Tax=Legionella fallonii LLAP-10 TaxID=1212491 RepID=A0A098G508_9GAMM|nr:hypothetical protein [Legionella fallonii]CEG57568.1 protein of unknown function [Legionella fallonii LLAP-10]